MSIYMILLTFLSLVVVANSECVLKNKKIKQFIGRRNGNDLNIVSTLPGIITN